MKNLRAPLSNWFDKLDRQWRELPVKKQRRYMLLFFSGYVLLTILVIGKVYCEVGKSGEGITIEHIENPVIPQNKSSVSPRDSITTILKRKLYEK